MQRLLLEYFLQIKIDSPQSHKNLAVYPLLSGYRVSLLYANLDEALAQNLITVTEVSEGGSVPQLMVVNHSETPVLIIDGEELVGAKQNRAVNTTILVAATAQTEIPVSCVEQGRWSYKSRLFKSEGRLMPAKIRGGKAEQVTHSLMTKGSYESDQNAIWCGIGELAVSLEAKSPSMDMGAAYQKEQYRLDQYTAGFAPVSGQIGAVFVIDGKVAGAEVFGKPETFAKMFHKLLESYAIEAINTEGEDFTADQALHERVLYFLGGILGCSFQSRQSVGLGIDVRLESIITTGFALVHEEQLLHLSVLRKPYIIEVHFDDFI